MDDEQTINVDQPETDAGVDPPASHDASDGYRPPRWAWFALGGLAVTVIAIAMIVAERDLLFADDFSASGALARWPEGEDSLGSTGYEDETYHVAVTQQGGMIGIADLPGRRSSIRIDVDAEMVSGTGGLSVLCITETAGMSEEVQAVPDQAEYYDVFMSFSDGAVAIFRPDQPAEPLAVVSTGLLRDGMNHVKVGCTGASEGDPAKLTVSINGTSVLDHTDPGGSTSFSAVGLSVYGPEGPAEAAFDNIEVTEL